MSKRHNILPTRDSLFGLRAGKNRDRASIQNKVFQVAV